MQYWVVGILALGLVANASTAIEPLPVASPGWRTLENAATELGFYSFDRAYVLFARVASDAPAGSELWQRATFGMALSAQQSSPPSAAKIAEAQSLYRALIDAHSVLAPRAWLNLGRIAELRDYPGDTIDLPAARESYQQILRQFPADPLAGEAVLRLAGTYIERMDLVSIRLGQKILETWLAEHGQDPIAALLWQYLGESYWNPPLREASKTLECLEKAEALGWADPSRKGVELWRMACLCDEFLKDTPRAIRYYRRVIEQTPLSGKAYEAQVALRRLGATP